MVELGKGKPQHAQISPNGTMLLVVIDGKCKLFTMGTFKQLWIVECGDGLTCIAASFVDDLTVLIWSKRGKAYLHRIPKNALQAMESDRMSKSRSQIQISAARADASDIPPRSASPAVGSTSSSSDFVVRKGSILDGSVSELVRMPPNWRPADSASQSLIAELSMRDHHDAKKTPLNDIHFGVFRTIAYLCHDNGQVEIWRIPEVFSDRDRIPYQLSSDYVGKFSDGWPSDRVPSSTEALQPAQPLAAPRFVTASLIVEKEMQMICGFSDGTISISKLPTDPSPVTWSAHRSTVNCLLLFRREKGNILISGSNDFYIKLWDLSSLSPGSTGEQPGKLLHTFSCHSGPVRSLFMPDAETAPKAWKNRFFSIGEDRSVALFQIDVSATWYALCLLVSPTSWQLPNMFAV